jgi:hypothetical protein
MWKSLPLVDRADGSTVIQSPFYVGMDVRNIRTSSGPALKKIAWDYESDTDIALPDLPSAGETKPIYEGVIWVWVKNSKLPSTGTALTPDLSPDSNQNLRQTVTRLDTYETLPSGIVFDDTTAGCFPIVPLPHFPLFMPGGFEPPPCTACGWKSIDKFLRVVAPPGQSPWIEAISPNGKDEIATGYFDAAFLTMVQDTSKLFVPASDGRGWANGSIAGAFIDRTTHALVGKARVSGNQVVVDTMSVGAGSGPLLAAVSARRAALAFVGERDGQGNVLPQLRVFDFDLGTQVTRPILIDDYRLVEPVAMTYVPQEDAYYVLDRATEDSSVLRLLRITKGMTLQRAAHWPNSGVMYNFGLTTTPRGQLVLSAWNASAHKVAILEFAQDGLQLLKLVSGTAPLAVPAYGGFDGTFVVRSVSGVIQRPEALPIADSTEPANIANLDQAF